MMRTPSFLIVCTFLCMVPVSFTGKVKARTTTETNNGFQSIWMLIQEKDPQALANWLGFYGIPATPSSFGTPVRTVMENHDLGSPGDLGHLAHAEFDVRELAFSPDLQHGLTYDGYFFDLSEIVEEEIGFDDSHDIVLYHAVDSSLRRVHFKGSTQRTDDLFWLDDNRFVLLGAENTGESEWVPYIQVSNLVDSSSYTYPYSGSVNDTAPFDYLLQRLRKAQDRAPLRFSGFFEGNEPFWNLEVKNNTFVLHCMNDMETGVILLSEKQAHSETYAFRGTNFFGIIRKPWEGCCELDITEEENPTHEIYFSYKGKTYMGCGWLRL